MALVRSRTCRGKPGASSTHIDAQLDFCFYNDRWIRPQQAQHPAAAAIGGRPLAPLWGCQSAEQCLWDSLPVSLPIPGEPVTAHSASDCLDMHTDAGSLWPQTACFCTGILLTWVICKVTITCDACIFIPCLCVSFCAAWPCCRKSGQTPGVWLVHHSFALC